MASMEAESVDAIVTDPPYGIGFMGKEFDTFTPEKLADQRKRHWKRAPRADGRKSVAWNNDGDAGSYDYRISANRTFQEWTRLWAVEALRVLKPGGFAAVFGGTRTYHRMICGLEDAGFEIRDCLSWNFGSGFPKSLDISAAIDAGACRAELEKPMGRAPTREEFKAAWKTFREVIGVNPSSRPNSKKQNAGGFDTLKGEGSAGIQMLTAPRTEAAKEHEGKGTALKPAWEPICLARKPLEGTVAENVLRYGTGGLNIEACRIGTDDTRCNKVGGGGKTFHGQVELPRVSGSENGRWPANLVLDEKAAGMLDEQSGERPAGGKVTGRESSHSGQHGIYSPRGRIENSPFYDSGGASRFFYCAKTSAWEREAGLEDLEPMRRSDGREKDIENPRLRTSSRRNHHPTVKPVSLMRWLVRLVVPPGGLVLDPFAGSGTTGMACAIEGFDFIGCEKESEYVEIARRRIEYARANLRAFDVGAVHAKPEKAVAGQRELF